MSVKALSWIVIVAALLAAALWWARDHPVLRPMRTLLPVALPAKALSGGPPAAAQARKCRSDTQVVYTDGPCPPGSREQALDGGTLTVVQAAKPLPAAASAASAQTPLRRLAGESGVPDQQERRVEQALSR